MPARISFRIGSTGYRGSSYGRGFDGGNGFGFGAFFRGFGGRHPHHDRDHHDRDDHHHHHDNSRGYDRHDYYDRGNLRVRARIHLGGGSYYNSGPHQVRNEPELDPQEMFAEHKRQAIENNQRTPEAYADYLNFAIREATAASRLIASNPENTKEIRADGLRQRSEEGQKIISNKRGELTFVNSSAAATALSKAFIAAHGDTAKLSQLDISWREASYLERGPKRDEQITNVMNKYATQWNRENHHHAEIDAAQHPVTSIDGIEVRRAERAVAANANATTPTAKTEVRPTERNTISTSKTEKIQSEPTAFVNVEKAAGREAAEKPKLTHIQQQLLEGKIAADYTFKNPTLAENKQVVIGRNGENLSVIIGNGDKPILMTGKAEELTKVVNGAIAVEQAPSAAQAKTAHDTLLATIRDAVKNGTLKAEPKDKALLAQALIDNSLDATLTKNSRVNDNPQYFNLVAPTIASVKTIEAQHTRSA